MDWQLTTAGLVLEGGGQRGIFTAGVLRHFMDIGLYCSNVYGVSIGSCNAANYISRQPERNRIIFTHFVGESRFCSWKRAFTQGELFGMDFLFHDIPHNLIPFDFTTFTQNPSKLWVTVTNCHTGKAEYFEKATTSSTMDEMLTIFRASSSLPLVAPVVTYNNSTYLDGGIADPIPIQQCLTHGCTKRIIILTKPAGYRKTASNSWRLCNLRYSEYPAMVQQLKQRHELYNDTLATIEEMEKRGDAFVIRPPASPSVGRATQNLRKLNTLYNAGHTLAKELTPALHEYLEQ